MERGTALFENWKALARCVPGAVKLVRLARRMVDPDLREIHRLRRDEAQQLFQPFPDTWEERYPALFDGIADRLTGLAEPRLLSFGCSSGAEVRAMRRRLPHARIVGLDLNRRSLDRARSADSGPLSSYRLAGKPGETERFDAILALAVFRHGVLEAERPEYCTKILRFERFEQGVAILDACLEQGGLLAIANAHFRFADTNVSARYEPIPIAMTEPDKPEVLYGPDDRRLADRTIRFVLFRKIA